MGSSTEEGDAGVELFIVTSWAGSRDKSSVGVSDGRAEGRCWVGVSGDGDMSSGGAGIGGGDGLGWTGWSADGEGEWLRSWQMASAGTGTEITLFLMVGGRITIISPFSCCWTRVNTGID